MTWGTVEAGGRGWSLPPGEAGPRSRPGLQNGGGASEALVPEQAPAADAEQGQLHNTSALVRSIRDRFAEAAGVRTLTVTHAGVQPPVPVRRRTILGGDVAVELGKPGLPSAVSALVAGADEVVDGRMTLVSPDLGSLAAGTALPLGVLVIAGAQGIRSVDCYGLRNAALRVDGLDGVSARAMPGRLWIRLSRDAHGRGVRVADLAQALYASCRRVRGVDSIEVLITCGHTTLVELLEPVATLASAQTGEHVRLKWNAFGDLECNSMDCRSCEEAPVCAQLRQVIKIRARRRRKARV